MVTSLLLFPWKSTFVCVRLKPFARWKGCNSVLTKSIRTWIWKLDGCRMDRALASWSTEQLTSVCDGYPTRKNARVCAIMSMWLVHIKEHVWTVRTCPTSILLPDCMRCNKADAETLCISLGCRAEAEMWIQLPCHLYAPQWVDLGGGGSFSQRNETLKGLARVKCFWYDVKSVYKRYINEIVR